MAMVIEEILDPGDKAAICDRILRSLPGWFGVGEAIVDYTASVKVLPFWTAVEDGREIGFAALKPLTQYSSDVYVMGVLEEYHRRSAGRHLIASLAEHSRNMGHRFLTVKTLSDEHPDPGYARTRLFYMSMGFLPLEYLDIWGPGNPCLLMAKAL